MGTAFFGSASRKMALEGAVGLWEGTPWRENSRVRGVGANCVGAIAGVLEDAGFALPDYTQARPSGVDSWEPGLKQLGRWCRDHGNSVMEEFLDAHPEAFESVSIEALQAGDVVGFRVGNCLHHLGVVLEGGRFFQCNQSMGAVVLSQAEKEFWKRLSRAWRPVEG